MGAGQKLVFTIAFAATVIIALVVAGVLILRESGQPPTDSVDSTTSKMFLVDQLCQNTQYTKTCRNSLAKANTTSRSELIMVEFKSAVQEIDAVLKKLDTLQHAAKTQPIRESYKLCQELLEDSLDDLYRTIDEFDHFDYHKMDKYILDLQTWLAGALTCQDTCLDSFEGTKGNAGRYMKKVLKTSREITINGLMLVNEFSKVAGDNEEGGGGGPPPVAGRKMLGGEPLRRFFDGYPAWVKNDKRQLLKGNATKIRPDVVVAKDGSGGFKSVNEALKGVPENSDKTFVIYIKEGVYEEYVHITKKMMNVMLIGDGPTKTKITGNRSYAAGIKTWSTATVSVDGFYFTAKDIGFENSAGSRGHQAVALRCSSDMSILYNCRIDGHQDTLYAHDHRQFYRDCTISGTIDFIFGDAAALFQHCTFIVRKPDPNQSCMVTAQGRRSPFFPTGIVLQNCSISGEPNLASATPHVKSYLGRPWKSHSRTVVVNSQISDVIEPEGWAPWNGTESTSTCWYAEFGNRGPGADDMKRVAWPGIKKFNTTDELWQFAPAKFLIGDEWIPQSGVPYQSGI